MDDKATPRVFHRARSGRIQIGSGAIETLRRYRQFSAEDHEAGGVLLGRCIIDSDHIVIDGVTVPQPGDQSSRHRFFRARKRHQQLIDAAWSESKGTVTYLGEWHTHPKTVPHPSVIDRAGWVKKLMLDEFTEAIFFVIVGTEELGVWEGRHRHPTQTRLREVSDVLHDY